MTGMQIFYIVTSALLWGCIFLNLSTIADNWRQNRLLHKLYTEGGKPGDESARDGSQVGAASEGGRAMIKLDIHSEGHEIFAAYEIDGGTEQLMDELACGAADVIMALADALPAQDMLHESLARVVCSGILAAVQRAVLEREKAGGAAVDEPPEA